MVKLDELLVEMVERNASDLYIKAGSPPNLRIDGVILPTDYPPLTPQDARRLAERVMNERQIQRFEENPDMDLALGLPGIGRFRVNVFRQRGTIGMVFRLVSNPNFSFDDLNLPDSVRSLAERPRGMVLVTGTTGSGKSTTLAAMINHINNLRKCHIVTIEDPIEFLHQDKMAILNQREVGFDTTTFSEALKHVLRQSPDVILIGEMRDLETMQTAILAAETGHLVLSTMHTTDSVQTIERIVNHFPAYMENQVRMELSMTLQGVIAQRLAPKAMGGGRVPACEIMINVPVIRKILAEGRTLELSSYIARGRQEGMQTFNQALVDLYRRGLVRFDDAILLATSPDEFRLSAKGIESGIQAAGMEA